MQALSYIPHTPSVVPTERKKPKNPTPPSPLKGKPPGSILAQAQFLANGPASVDDGLLARPFLVVLAVLERLKQHSGIEEAVWWGLEKNLGQRLALRRKDFFGAKKDEGNSKRKNICRDDETNLCLGGVMG